MRIDQEQATLHQPFETSSPEGRPATVQPKAGGLSTLGLALLTVVTSWAIAASASIWLVPPYLILMAWLLYPSTGRPSGVLEEADEGQSDPLRPAGTGEDSDRSDVSREGSASAGSSEEGSDPETSASPAKARRGKGRPKKVKPAPIEPTEATWLQVAPGKFVRVEAAGSPDPVGPHGSPVGLIEDGETPQTPDSNRDESESPEISQPNEEVESGSSPVEDFDDETDPTASLERPSEVDGNAPQAEGEVEIDGAETLGVQPETTDDRLEACPSAGVLSAKGDSSPLSETFEPIGLPPLPLTDVPPEDVQEWGESLEEADPTETPVDETDFDDAGPFVADHPQNLDASAEDADLSEMEADPVCSTGSTRSWPWRFTPRENPRSGHPPRTSERPTIPRRLVRTSGPPPGPSSPRRSLRQRAPWPHRITRAFPPRSPPRRSFSFRRPDDSFPIQEVLNPGSEWSLEEWSVVSGRKRRDDRRRKRSTGSFCIPDH